MNQPCDQKPFKALTWRDQVIRNWSNLVGAALQSTMLLIVTFSGSKIAGACALLFQASLVGIWCFDAKSTNRDSSKSDTKLG